MLCHGHSKSQLQGDYVTGYISRGLWVCSPQLSCTFGELRSTLEPQKRLSAAAGAEDSRNAKLLLSALEPRITELSSCDCLLDPSTYLSSHRVQFFLFPVKEVAADKNVFTNISFRPQVPPELTVLMTSACKTSAVPSLFLLPQRKAQCFIFLS